MQTGILVSLGCMQGVGPPDKAWLACRNASVSQTGCITFLFVMDEISSLSEPSGTRVWCHFPLSPTSLWWMLTLEHHLPTDCPSISTQTLCSDQSRRGLDVRYMGVWGLITQAWQSEFNPQTKVKCQIWWCTSVNFCNPTPTATWEAETGEWAGSLWVSLECTLQQRKRGLYVNKVGVVLGPPQAWYGIN